MTSAQPQELQPASAAVDQDDLKIPLIDFGPFFTGTPSDKHAVALSVTEAFKTSGFLYLKSHGIPPSVVSEVFASSARFFARPQSEKDSLSWTSPQSNRGYVAIGREKLFNVEDKDDVDVDTLRSSAPDIKESMEIGREGVEGLPNRWPDHDEEGKAFKKTMQSFFEMGQTLHKQIMQAIALGMNLPEHFFDDFINDGDNDLRLLHYPPVSKEVFRQNPNQVRAGEHSDYGSVTLLFQDRHGGLQVRSPKGTFVDATPIADTIIVNAGDLLARWSNDTIKSTRHRVVQPPMAVGEGSGDDSSDEYPSRYSVAYFCQPNLDKLIETLPGTYGEGTQVEKKYSAITSGDYLVQRLTETY